MKSTLSTVFLFVLLITVGQGRAANLPSACGDDKLKLDVSLQDGQPSTPTASPDKATLIFVQRMGTCIGCSTTRIGLDGSWVGADRGNSYFAVLVAPGEHHVCASWSAPLARMENKIGLTELQAEAGQMYYFEIEVGPRGANDVPVMRLKPISGDMGAFLVSRSKTCVATPKNK